MVDSVFMRLEGEVVPVLRNLGLSKTLLIESFEPGLLDQLGLRLFHPWANQLAFILIRPFGQTNPYASWSKRLLISGQTGA